MTQTQFLGVAVLLSALVLVWVLVDLLLFQRAPDELEQPGDDDTAPLRVGRWVR